MGSSMTGSNAPWYNTWWHSCSGTMGGIVVDAASPFTGTISSLSGNIINTGVMSENGPQGTIILAGNFSGVINNAGLMLLGDMTQQDPDEWDRMLDVNVKGLLNGVHAVIKGMVERRHGTIINVSSTSGRKTYPGHVAYVGTKHAVHALSENLREEVSPHNVRVIVIAPGACDTELQTITTDDAVKAGFKEWKEEIGGVILAASEVAEAIRFAYEQPQKVCIREIVLASTNQPV